jgi:hypothetical protein
MTKTEHLHFLVLLLPTFLILVAAAVSMADLEFPAPEHTYTTAHSSAPSGEMWDDSPAE